MLDFTGVTAITIPEGNVTKIARGSTVLWEKPAGGDESNYIVVFPLTNVSVHVVGGDSLSGILTLSRTVSNGEKYIICVNGTEYEATVKTYGSTLTLITTADNSVYLQSVTGGFQLRMNGVDVSPSAALEVRYIPE